MSAIVDEGVSLLAVVEAGSSGKRLDELSVARVIADAAEALDGAAPRTQPIVPAGVFILLNGSVKLETKLVPLREAIGYTAPEKLKGGSSDHRGDVFSLGVVMWEALTHARLFSGATEAEMKASVLESELHPPSEQNANIPSELDAICMKALARDPDARYATAKAMAVEIEGVLRDAGYGRTNEPIAAHVGKLPDDLRKPVGARGTLPPPKREPEPPKIQSAVAAGLAAAPVQAKAAEPPLVPMPPKLPEEPRTSTIIGISSTPREPAKTDTVVDAPSLAKGSGADTVMGVPSLASMLPEAKPGTNTVMGVPSLASVLPEAKPEPAPSPAGSMPAIRTVEEPLVLTPKPPKLPAAVNNGPHKVPPAVAAAVTQAVPAAQVELAKPSIPPADDDFAEEPNPAEAVSLPRAKSETGPQDQLARWAWSTDTHTALVDDDPLDEIPPPSKRPLFIAIGAAAGVLGLIAIIAFAVGGSKDDKDKKDQQQSVETETAPPPAPPKQETPPPAEPPQQDQAAQAEPAKQDTPPAEPPKQEPPAPEPAKPEPAVAKTEPPAPEPPKQEPPSTKAPAGPPPAVVAKVEPPKPEPPKPEPKAAAKPEPPKTLAKAEPPKPAKPEPPKKDPKTAAKTPPAKPTRVATKAKPLDPYADVPAKKGDAQASYREGLQLFARGDTSGALASLKTSLNENPRFPPTWRGLGLVYEKMGDRTQAARAYRRYLQLAPNAGDAEVIRGRLERLGS